MSSICAETEDELIGDPDVPDSLLAALELILMPPFF